MECLDCGIRINNNNILCNICKTKQISYLEEHGEDTNTALRLFQKRRLQEIDERHREIEMTRKRRKLKEHNEYQWHKLNLQMFVDALVVKCYWCNENRECNHLSAEEFQFFWRLRGTCRAWKKHIEDWLSNKIVCSQDPETSFHSYINGKKHPKINISIFSIHQSPGSLLQIVGRVRESCLCATKGWHDFLEKFARKYNLQICADSFHFYNINIFGSLRDAEKQLRPGTYTINYL